MREAALRLLHGVEGPWTPRRFGTLVALSASALLALQLFALAVPKYWLLWLAAAAAVGAVVLFLPFFYTSRVAPLLLASIALVSLAPRDAKFWIAGRALSATLPAAALLTGGFLVVSLRNGRAETPFLPLVLLHTIVAASAVAMSRFPDVAIVGLVYVVFFFLIYYATLNALQTPGQVRMAYMALVLVAAVLILLTWAQFVRTGLTGAALGRILPFTNRNAVIASLVPTLPLVVAWALSRGHAALWTLSALGVGAFILLGGRGGLMALAVGLAVVVPRLRAFALFAALGAVTLWLVGGEHASRLAQNFTFLLSTDALLDEVESGQSIASGARSILYRWAILNAGVNMFLDSPILGWGRDTGVHMMDFYNFPAAVPLAVDVSGTLFHNAYLRLLVETGVLGLVTMVALQVGVIAMLFRASKRLPDGLERFWIKGLLAGMLARAVFAATSHTFNTTTDFLYMGLAVAAVRRFETGNMAAHARTLAAEAPGDEAKA